MNHYMQIPSPPKLTISRTLGMAANIGFAATTLAAYFGLYGSQISGGQGFFFGMMLFCCLRLCALAIERQLFKSLFSMVYFSFMIIAILLYCTTLEINPLFRVGCLTTILTIFVINLHSVTVKLHVHA